MGSETFIKVVVINYVISEHNILGCLDKLHESFREWNTLVRNCEEAEEDLSML